MKPIAEKILKSGLVDKHMARMLEIWGYLPDGSYSEVPDKNIFEKATREQLQAFADELGEEADKQLKMKETSFDLEKLKWPTEVNVKNANGELVVRNIQALIDRMGRYYFRFQDVLTEWFIPGGFLLRGDSKETILEQTTLYIDDQPIAVQVTTTRT